MAAITTNEMIFRTLKTKVFNYKGERNPEPKYAEQLRQMGYEVRHEAEDAYDEDERWMVNGHMIKMSEGRVYFNTANGYVEGMANIGKIDFVNLFKVWDERKEKRASMNAHDEIVDNSFYTSAYDWYRNVYRNMRVTRGYNAVIENYKNLRERIDRNCRWERDDLIRAEKKLEEAMKNLERTKARLAKAEASNEEDLAKIDEILKKHGVCH